MDPELLKRKAQDGDTKQVIAPLILKADDNTGAFEAVFSTFDVVDSDMDVVLASAIPDGKQVPVVWHHNWTQPVGRGVVKVDINRAVIAGRFFLETEAGAEAYKTVKAMAELQEWSWGFRILEASYEQREEEWIRLIKKVDIFEVSPVLRGAGMNTGTLAIKSRTLADHFEACAGAVSDVVSRVKSLADLRAKEGRTLSEANRQRLATLRDQMASAITEVDDLLAATEPKSATAAAELHAEMMFYQRTIARQHGLDV